MLLTAEMYMVTKWSEGNRHSCRGLSSTSAHPLWAFKRVLKGTTSIASWLSLLTVAMLMVSFPLPTDCDPDNDVLPHRLPPPRELQISCWRHLQPTCIPLPNSQRIQSYPHVKPPAPLTLYLNRMTSPSTPFLLSPHWTLNKSVL